MRGVAAAADFPIRHIHGSVVCRVPPGEIIEEENNGRLPKQYNNTEECIYNSIKPCIYKDL